MGRLRKSLLCHVHGAAPFARSIQPSVNIETGKFMGKSWKEKPGKYRHNKDFQKKQQKHSKGQRPFTTPTDDMLGDTGHNPLADMGVQGCDDFETCG
jgi:hypothetical protein